MFVYLIPDPLPAGLLAHPHITLRDEEEVRYIIESNDTLGLETSQTPSYESIDAVGPLSGGAHVVLNNIPVSEEGRSDFEARFMNRARKVEEEPGFIGIRVLRPLNSDTYVILTVWLSEEHFRNWQQSQAYNHAHSKRGTSQGLAEQKSSVFPRPSFVKAYTVG